MNGWLLQSLGIVKVIEEVLCFIYVCSDELLIILKKLVWERNDVLKLIHLCFISQLSVVGVYVCILIHNASWSGSDVLVVLCKSYMLQIIILLLIVYLYKTNFICL